MASLIETLERDAPILYGGVFVAVALLFAGAVLIPLAIVVGVAAYVVADWRRDGGVF